ncbi:Copper transporter 6 [Ananas comosus]|uniref:Copper transport protein n=1 Tax=Ananas comosus TaxID=4615 RepID=A0A199UI79_ANACO|nr:Copper transporter 6 [Ananas comosus]
MGDMGDMGDMDMGNHTHGSGAPPSPMSMGGMKMSYVHMTFFWGKNSEILFSGWPGTRSGMYALALIVVFLLAVLVEWTARYDVGAAPRLVRTAVHALRVGLAYLMMLAVMSFNGGVFIVAVAGHTVGFLLFRSRPASPAGDRGEKAADLSPMAC